MAVKLPGGILDQSDVRETITNTEETSVGWNLSYVRYEHLFDTSLADGTHGLYISPDGIHIYVVTSGATDRVHQYLLSTTWDITSATFVRSLSVNDKEPDLRTVYFKQNGTKMYIAGSAGKVFEYNLGTAWDLSTAVYSQDFDFTSQTAGTDELYIREDGKQFFISSTANIYSYTLTTAWDITSAEYVELKNTITESILTMQFSSDGAYIFFNKTGGTIERWALSIVFRISTMTADTDYIIGPTGNALGIAFKPNGSKMYLLIGTKIQEYTIKRGWR